MEYGVSRCQGSIFIDNGKGGRGDDILHAQCFAYGLDEGGLASPHASIKGKYAMVADVFYKCLGCLIDVGNVFDVYFHIFLSFLSWAHGDERHNHLFHRNASMLESILVIGYIIVVIVGVGKE